MNEAPDRSKFLVAIFTAPAATVPMVARSEVQAVPGRGLEGDRYFALAGTFSKGHEADAEVTLIESEAIEALARDSAIRISVADSRRNLVTRGVSLNDLVGRDFMVGDVRLRGHGLCEPCAHLDRLLGRRDLVRALRGHGGLRAEVLTAGTLRVGDVVREG
jgi:MOSC domain-containing protein YiiM